MDLLRFATAGSVDDGKSTLVGRLLHDTKSVLADQLAAVELVSRTRGNEQVDLALLTDGLRAEREQGITIDVAYRYFATGKRKFILADTPGHEQYTRNMVTGASTAELVVLLIDARLGIQPQTFRHTTVSALLGVRHLLLAINKMDLVDFDEDVFNKLSAEFALYAKEHGIEDVVTVPVSALNGDNIVNRSEAMPWYTGPTLLEALEDAPVGTDPSATPLRLPVQLVIRPQTAENPDYRGYAGQLASGVVKVGDEVVVLPAGHRTTVSSIDTPRGSVDEAFAPQSIVVQLADDVDVSRGDFIAAAADAPTPTRELDATVCWLAEAPLNPGQRVLVKHATRTVRGVVDVVVDRLDVSSLERHEQVNRLELNDIGRVHVRLAGELPAEPYSQHRTTGGFLLIDEQDGTTLAAGMVGNTHADQSLRCL